MCQNGRHQVGKVRKEREEVEESTPSLSLLFRLAHWSYGADSPLLMNRGRLAAELMSCEGVR